MPSFANLSSFIFFILEETPFCLLCANSEKFKENFKVTPILPFGNMKANILMCFLFTLGCTSRLGEPLPPSGIEPVPQAVEVLSISQWASREFPTLTFLIGISPHFQTVLKYNFNGFTHQSSL